MTSHELSEWMAYDRVVNAELDEARKRAELNARVSANTMKNRGRFRGRKGR